jgi:hypothetical protein
VVYLTNRTLSTKAMELVNFDIDSIRQTVTARHAHAPAFWVADPDQYERNGRVLRDSESPRLLAYSHADRILYANDGCNSCIHALPADLSGMNKEQIRSLASDTKIRPELIEKIVEIAIIDS